MVTTKRPAVIHNLVKIKALLFLSMRQEAGKGMATAKEIAIATGGSADSLYVLLQRWSRWGLVSCMGILPYRYSIDDEGMRYLSKIDSWFFSGYYSKKRKKRVPGYRGKVEVLQREIAIASEAVYWWRYPPRREDQPASTVYYIKAPFEKATDFVKVERSEGRSVTWGKSRLLVRRFGNAHQAYIACQEWGFKQKRQDLGEAIVDANVGMVWAKDNG